MYRPFPLPLSTSEQLQWGDHQLQAFLHHNALDWESLFLRISSCSRKGEKVAVLHSYKTKENLIPRKLGSKTFIITCRFY